jgi:hypothetical protein
VGENCLRLCRLLRLYGEIEGHKVGEKGTMRAAAAADFWNTIDKMIIISGLSLSSFSPIFS